jgi:hypothetical protein
MNIQELSIGDWVRYRDREWQVCSLYQFTEEVGLWRKDSQFCETITDIQPIRITSEILEKNGLEFIDDGNDAIIFLCCDMFWARLCVGDCFWSIGVHSEDRLDAVICDVKYVHQLQHVLRLAGVGKEIKL